MQKWWHVEDEGCGAFTQFERIWGNKHLKLSTKVQVFDTFVVLHFLYGSETWNLTQTQQKRLEMAYNNCLKRMLGMKVTDRHCLTHIWQVCKAKPLTLLLSKHMLKWLGHVAKLPQDRYPHIALLTHLQGAHYPYSRPRYNFAAILKGDFLVAGIPTCGGEWYEQAQDKYFWRPMV
jgi:hypothetical protein